jgi:hypothetical protein
MEPTPELINALYREQVLAARKLSPAQRLRLGGDLFDDFCERMRAGIRFQFPDADENRVEQILRERLELARRLEQIS